MISLIEYAETVNRKEDFLEYLRCFTGYGQHSKRTDSECASIYKNFEKKYNENITYSEFLCIYIWEFVRQRQLCQITNEEYKFNEELLHDLEKNITHPSYKTFTEWKIFYNDYKNDYKSKVPKLTKEELLMKDFNYWIGNTFSDGTNVTKDKAWFLTTLKKKYLEVLSENQKLNNKLAHIEEKSLQDDIEIAGLKKINSELTKENLKLNRINICKDKHQVSETPHFKQESQAVPCYKMYNCQNCELFLED